MTVDLVVRWLHVTAAAVAVGGSAAMVVALVAAGRDTSLGGFQRFEWIFWAALGVLVATGIGMLARYGGALPGTDTRWGAVLAMKLVLVALIAGVSLVRTMHLVRLALVAPSMASLAALRTLYAVTASLGVIVLLLAQVLAHG